MSRCKLLRIAELGPQHRLSGKVRHYYMGKLLPAAAVLKIYRYVDEPGYYLVRFDGAGEYMTDTLHDTLEHALGQAAFEYDGPDLAWRDVGQTH